MTSASTWGFIGALGGTRTPNLLIRSQMLYPLSYERWLEKYTAAGALTMRVAGAACKHSDGPGTVPCSAYAGYCRGQHGDRDRDGQGHQPPGTNAAPLPSSKHPAARRVVFASAPQ